MIRDRGQARVISARSTPVAFRSGSARAWLARPRLYLIRFHGVLAPNAGLRAAIVPGTAGKLGELPERAS